jgi:hypothetical protein
MTWNMQISALFFVNLPQNTKKMKKFIALDVYNMRLDSVAGLISETVTLTTPYAADLGELGATELQALTAAINTMLPQLNRERGSVRTPLIVAEDRTRDARFAEAKRAISAAIKSRLPGRPDAGRVLMDFFKPFWHIHTEHLPSQTAQIHAIKKRISDDPALAHAAQTLGIDGVLAEMFAANERLQSLYDERLDETARRKGPSATSLKREVAAAYSAFCVALETTLSALPTEALQHVFNEMNDLRRKYIFHQPTRLSLQNTTVASIPLQAYTGRAATPLPCVHVELHTGTVELEFGRDFSVTYRNNVKVGEASLTVHGKGKYRGRVRTTFHIVEGDKRLGEMESF